MKAKDYFEKYREQMTAAKTAEEYADIIFNINTEMRSEMIDMIKKRKIASESALKGTIMEFNDKWNAIIRLFNKAEIPCYMKFDGFYQNEKKCLAEGKIFI